MVAPKKLYPCLKPWNLWIVPYLFKKVIKLKVFFFCLFVFLPFLGPHLWHVEVPRLGVPQPQPQHEIWAESVTYTTTHGNARSLTHRARPGIEPVSSCILVRFVSTEPWWELPKYFIFYFSSSMSLLFPMVMFLFMSHSHLFCGFSSNKKFYPLIFLKKQSPRWLILIAAWIFSVWVSLFFFPNTISSLNQRSDLELCFNGSI